MLSKEILTTLSQEILTGTLLSPLPPALGMNNTGKAQALLATLLVLLCLTLPVIGTANAQQTFTPTAPEFTIKFSDRSHNVPPVTTSRIDPYNNKTITTTIPGYQVKDQTIQITIKNQFYPTQIGGNKTTLQYSIQTKPHFSDDWTTVVTLQAPSDGSNYSFQSLPANYKGEDEIDFRIQAVLNYEHVVYEYTRLPVFGSDVGWYPFNHTDIYSTSQWSSTQTFTMPSEPTSSPANISISQETLLAITTTIAVVALIAAVIAILLYSKNRRATKSLNSFILE